MFEDLRYFQNQLRMGDQYCYPEDKLWIERELRNGCSYDVLVEWGLIKVAKVGEQI